MIGKRLHDSLEIAQKHLNHDSVINIFQRQRSGSPIKDDYKNICPHKSTEANVYQKRRTFLLERCVGDIIYYYIKPQLSQKTRRRFK